MLLLEMQLRYMLYIKSTWPLIHKVHQSFVGFNLPWILCSNVPKCNWLSITSELGNFCQTFDIFLTIHLNALLININIKHLQFLFWIKFMKLFVILYNYAQIRKLCPDLRIFKILWNSLIFSKISLQDALKRYQRVLYQL